MSTSIWSVQFKPSKGRGPFMCYRIEAETKVEAIKTGRWLINIEGGQWQLVKVIEVQPENE